MRRLFWVAVGATAGIVVAHKVRRTAQRISPPALALSLSQAVAGIRHDIRDFTEDVRLAMEEREAQLHGALGLGQGSARDYGHPQLPQLTDNVLGIGLTREEAS
jgi:hypothetical protein